MPLADVRLYYETVASDYNRALAQIERRFTAPSDVPRGVPSTGELLALVNALREEALSETQRETLSALRSGMVQ